MLFTIPRNVKKGQSFLGLELKGWILFVLTAPVCVGIGWAILLLSGKPPLGYILGGSLLGLFYYMYSIDERTGAMNGVFLIDLIDWMYAEKIQIYWRDDYYEQVKTLMVRVNFEEWEKE